MADAKKADDEDDEKKGACQLSTNMIKLVTLITLLVSDFDILMTLVCLYAYLQAGGVFTMGMGVIGFFVLIYIAACVYAGMESTKFIIRFKDKIRMQEINGISLDDLDDALAGRRIFWMGCEKMRLNLCPSSAIFRSLLTLTCPRAFARARAGPSSRRGKSARALSTL